MEVGEKVVTDERFNYDARTFILFDEDEAWAWFMAEIKNLHKHI